MATSSIGATGRDYLTIDGWWGSLPSTLTEAEVGELYNDSEFSKASVITLSSVTTSATNTATITTATGESFIDDASASSNALTYNQSNGVGIKCTGSYTNLMDITVDDLFISKLQFITTGTGGAVSGLHWTAAPARDGRVDQCIVKSGNGNSTAAVVSLAGTTNVLVNCLFEKEGSGASFGIKIGAGQPSVLACTVVDPHGDGNAMSRPNYSDLDIKGSAFFGWDEARETGKNDIDVDHCVTDLADANNSSGIDTNNLVSKTFSSQFEDISTSTPDFRLKSGSDCEGNAAQITETGDIDIIGQTRNASTPDVGCWEFQSVASIPPALRTLSLSGAGV